MVILTGDTHRDFARIFEFCEEYGTTWDDILVILGDAGINYCLDESDEVLKRELSRLEVTLLCVHGNHEARPSEILSYGEVEWHSGLVYAEPEYPNLLFAKDGEIYDLEGRTAMAIGGAYSVDKYYRIANRLDDSHNLFCCDTVGALGDPALLKLENVLCMDVSAGRTREAFGLLSEKVLANIKAHLQSN